MHKFPVESLADLGKVGVDYHGVADPKVNTPSGVAYVYEVKDFDVTRFRVNGYFIGGGGILAIICRGAERELAVIAAPSGGFRPADADNWLRYLGSNLGEGHGLGGVT